MDIVLYGRPFNRSDRVQWLLEELGLVYRYRVLDVFELEHRVPDIRARYPLARLPFVEIDGRVMFESGAIMLWLAQRFRHRADLLPEDDDADYRDTLQWLFFAISTLEISDEALEPGARPQPRTPLVDTLQFVESALEGRRHIAAGRFTVADIALANGFKWFDPEQVGRHPNIVRYCSGHMARPAYRKIVEQAQYPERARRLFQD